MASCRFRPEVTLAVLLAISIGLWAARGAQWTLFFEQVQEAGEWTNHNLLVGALVFIPFEVIWVVLCVPTTPLELAAGFAFGCRWGLIVDLLGKLLGGALSFVIGRYCFRDVIAEACIKGSGGGGLMRSVDRALATSGDSGQSSLKLLVLIQLACESFRNGPPGKPWPLAS